MSQSINTITEQAAQPPEGDLLRLFDRGFFNQCTNTKGLASALAEGCMPVYAGFDLTADSLHVGHLLPIMTLRHLQQLGHKPIVLLGSGTTRIGDPSFRSDGRPMLTDEQIATNKRGIQKAFDRFLTIGDGPTDALILDNSEWLDMIGYIDMLRLIGPHFSVNRMLSFDSVKSRLARSESMSFLEFNYMCLQAFDFLELSRRTGCRVQIGGGDQWGNIVCGIDLVRKVDDQEVFGLTQPLLTTASGGKMGKTASGAVWLNAERLDPSAYWQFWRNTEDADVLRFLRMFTDISSSEIDSFMQASGPELNALKERLATEATTLAHGPDAAARATAKAAAIFGGDGRLEPETLLSHSQLEAGVLVVEVLQMLGLASSRSDARRSIVGRGVRLNGLVIESELARISSRDFGLNATASISLGKKRHVVLGIGGQL